MIASNIIAWLLDYKNTQVHITEAVQEEKGMEDGGGDEDEDGSLV